MQQDTEELSYYVPGPVDEGLDLLFNVHSLTLGSSYRLASLGGTRGPKLSVSSQITGYVIPETLQNDQRTRGVTQLG